MAFQSIAKRLNVWCLSLAAPASLNRTQTGQGYPGKISATAATLTRDLEIDVVVYRPEFKEAFKRLNLEWIEKYFAVEKKDLKQLENPEKCIEDGGQIFFALAGPEVVGTVALYPDDPGVYELAKMAVSPAFQGKGVGDKLMQHCEAWVMAQNGNRIYLQSNDALTAALSLYQKHGYRIFQQGGHSEYARSNIGMEKSLHYQ